VTTRITSDWYADVATILADKLRDGADSAALSERRRAWVDGVMASLEAGKRTVHIPAELSRTGEEATVRLPARVAAMSGAR